MVCFLIHQSVPKTHDIVSPSIFATGKEHTMLLTRCACAARVTVVVLCVCVCQCVQAATTYRLSIVLAREIIWHFSYNGLILKIAIALPYPRVHGSRHAKRARFAHSFRILRLIARVHELLLACVANG